MRWLLLALFPLLASPAPACTAWGERAYAPMLLKAGRALLAAPPKAPKDLVSHPAAQWLALSHDAPALHHDPVWYTYFAYRDLLDREPAMALARFATAGHMLVTSDICEARRLSRLILAGHHEAARQILGERSHAFRRLRGLLAPIPDRGDPVVPFLTSDHVAARCWLRDMNLALDVPGPLRSWQRCRETGRRVP